MHYNSFIWFLTKFKILTRKSIFSNEQSNSSWNMRGVYRGNTLWRTHFRPFRRIAEIPKYSWSHFGLYRKYRTYTSLLRHSTWTHSSEGLWRPVSLSFAHSDGRIYQRWIELLFWKKTKIINSVDKPWNCFSGLKKN